jgi:hypothetical protein
MKGITPEDKRDRRHLLAENLDQLIDAMKQSGIFNPVGIVVDATDRLGSVLCRTALLKSGMTDEEAAQKLNEMTAQMAERNQFPTATFVVSWAMAEHLLPLTSPTAKKNLFEMQAQYQIGKSSRYLVVAIGNGGNTYGVADIPEMPRPAPIAHDGQHRHKGIHFPGN